VGKVSLEVAACCVDVGDAADLGGEGRIGAREKLM